MKVFKLRSLFKFVTDQSFADMDEKIKDMIQEVEEKGFDTDKELQEIFMGINIPRSLFEFDYLDLDRMLKLKLERERLGLD